MDCNFSQIIMTSTDQNRRGNSRSSNSCSPFNFGELSRKDILIGCNTDIFNSFTHPEIKPLTRKLLEKHILSPDEYHSTPNSEDLCQFILRKGEDQIESFLNIVAAYPSKKAIRKKILIEIEQCYQTLQGEVPSASQDFQPQPSLHHIELLPLSRNHSGSDIDPTDCRNLIPSTSDPYTDIEDCQRLGIEDADEVEEEEQSSGISLKLIKYCEEWEPPKLLYFCVIRLLWAVLYFFFSGQSTLPRGQIWALLVIQFFGIILGEIFSLVKLPPLLGMLTLGIIIRNVPYLDFLNDFNSKVSSNIRQLALTVILIRAGLGLDPGALMRLKGVVIRLAFCPCVAEAITVGIASHFILGFPWLWGFLLGFVLAAVSPAVVVPSLLSLSERGFGVDKGIPTIVIAASSVDDILAISAFGLVLGFTFSQGGSLIESLIQGPLELVLGVTFGILWGGLLGLFFAQSEKDDKNSMIIRVLLTLGGGCLSVFGFPWIGFPGSGALGCLAATFIAAVFWRKKGVLHDNDNLTKAFSILWFVFQPLLFGLIGCEIDLINLDLAVVGLGIICLCIGLTVRLIVTYFTVTNSGLNLKERIFVAIAWVPKATVQAAIGPIALDTARRLNAGSESEDLGLQLLTLAVLAILITAPIGATAVMLLGPKLLSSSKRAKGKGSDISPNLDISDRDTSLQPFVNSTKDDKTQNGTLNIV